MPQHTLTNETKLLHLAATLAASTHRIRQRIRRLQCWPVRLGPLRPRGVVLANIAEGQHLASQGITLEADVAITGRNLLMKRGGAANRVTICSAADTFIGVCSDEADAPTKSAIVIQRPLVAM